MSAFKIISCTTSADVDAATALFKAYTTSLNLDLTFQDLTTELSNMPGKYSPSVGGRLLLALDSYSNEALGVVALRALSEKICEIKRLYVIPAVRGSRLGKALAERVVEEARVMGYSEVKLDTLPRMESARKLYAELGFEECERYYETPLVGTLFMCKILND